VAWVFQDELAINVERLFHDLTPGGDVMVLMRDKKHFATERKRQQGSRRKKGSRSPKKEPKTWTVRATLFVLAAPFGPAS